MSVTILYFARLRETLGIAQEKIELPAHAASVAGLLDHLRARGEEWHAALAPTQSYRVAVNQDMADITTPVRDGDEVAIFPPVTGG
ncbi:MAG: molybdopterin converting factor subunit 1 [Burkholderiales bacterium]|nr:molybdopterin converting factor subunit 1 [Burkholderiales bacterium]